MALKLTEIKDLRRFTICPIFRPVMRRPDPALDFPPVLTITSTVFCEFVLVLGRDRIRPDRIPGGRWAEIDRFLYERFAKRGDFRFVIQADDLDVLDSFRRGTQEGFPLLAGRGCIHFEICPLIYDYWW